MLKGAEMNRPAWMIDELAHAGEEHLDPEYVAAYDAKSQTDHSQDLNILHDLGLGSESTVVDLGAGTGTFALAVASHCKRVVAVDVSPTMLEIMRANVEKQGLTNVEIVHAGLLSYEHEGGQADFVYTRNTLHHLPDFWKGVALQRITRMLRQGGVLRLHDLVYSFEPSEAEERFESWLTNAPTDPAKGFTREDLELHIRTESSTYSWLLEPLLERTGFIIRQVDYRPSGTFAAYVCVKR